MPNVPTWIQYLQALSTPAIALLAVTIGVLQWRTAHQRAVLDLFDRRMENYDALNAAIFEILREGKATTTNLVWKGCCRVSWKNQTNDCRPVRS